MIGFILVLILIFFVIFIIASIISNANRSTPSSTSYSPSRSRENCAYQTKLAGISFGARDQTVGRIIEEIYPGTADKYHEFGELLATIDLELETEPDNPHDPNAIGVWYRKNGSNHRLGYIPKNETREVRKYMNSAPSVVGYVYSSGRHHMSYDWLEDHETKHFVRIYIYHD